MRKFLLALFCLVIASTTLMAKEAGRSQLEVSGSYLMTKFYDELYHTGGVDAEKEYGSGYNFDVTLKYFVSPELAFRVGAGYTSHEAVVSLGSVDDKYTFKFFNLHAGLDYYLTEIAYAGFGLNYGILADDVDHEYDGLSGKIKDGTDGYTLNNNLSVYFEVGIDYPIDEQLGFILAITGEYSLNKVLENSDVDAYEFQELKLISVGIKAGISFSF